MVSVFKLGAGDAAAPAAHLAVQLSAKPSVPTPRKTAASRLTMSHCVPATDLQSKAAGLPKESDWEES